MPGGIVHETANQVFFFFTRAHHLIAFQSAVPLGGDGLCGFSSIAVYTEQAFDDLAAQINALPMSKRITLQRILVAGAADAEPDKQGRILIPARLRELAGIEGEAVVAGVADHCEIWSAERWEKLSGGFTDEDLMEALKGADF